LPYAMQKLVALTKKLEAYEKSDQRQANGSPSPSSSISKTPTGGNGPTSFMEGLMNADFS
jgi:hypothetical protein